MPATRHRLVDTPTVLVASPGGRPCLRKVAHTYLRRNRRTAAVVAVDLMPAPNGPWDTWLLHVTLSDGRRVVQAIGLGTHDPEAYAYAVEHLDNATWDGVHARLSHLDREQPAGAFCSDSCRCGGYERAEDCGYANSPEVSYVR